MNKYIKYSDIPFCKIELEGRCHNDRWTEIHEVAYKTEIDRIPATDVAPVVHGKWIEKEESFKYNYGSGTKTLCICNVCGYTQEPSLYSNYNYFNKTKYCPNCGAKMDGEP